MKARRTSTAIAGDAELFAFVSDYRALPPEHQASVRFIVADLGKRVGRQRSSTPASDLRDTIDAQASGGVK